MCDVSRALRGGNEIELSDGMRSEHRGATVFSQTSRWWDDRSSAAISIPIFAIVLTSHLSYGGCQRHTHYWNSSMIFEQETLASDAEAPAIDYRLPLTEYLKMDCAEFDCL